VQFQPALRFKLIDIVPAVPRGLKGPRMLCSKRPTAFSRSANCLDFVKRPTNRSQSRRAPGAEGHTIISSSLSHRGSSVDQVGLLSRNGTTAFWPAWLERAASRLIQVSFADLFQDLFDRL
jgi:hypothetical protein